MPPRIIHQGRKFIFSPHCFNLVMNIFLENKVTHDIFKHSTMILYFKFMFNELNCLAKIFLYTLKTK